MITKNELHKIITDSGYKYAGLRLDDNHCYAVGDMCRNSYEFEARTYAEAIANGEDVIELDGTYCFDVAVDGEFVDGFNFDKFDSYIVAHCDYYCVTLIASDNTADFCATDIATFGTCENLLKSAKVIKVF